jgi:hypothetical protein
MFSQVIFTCLKQYIYFQLSNVASYPHILRGIWHWMEIYFYSLSRKLKCWYKTCPPSKNQVEEFFFWKFDEFYPKKKEYITKYSLFFSICAKFPSFFFPLQVEFGRGGCGVFSRLPRWTSTKIGTFTFLSKAS